MKDMSAGEKEQFKEVLHEVPLTFTIMDMDPDHARAMAKKICKEIFQSLIDQGRESGEFRNVMWEPIKIEVDTGEEKDVPEDRELE